ncbi:GNAT family N-acetyltransferase [Levilactobacillus tujiorum]|uniref:GNAT family N-acetyltransferase n=1 Tax=Levilactobacillus tujiorum TaxID=2912243 RepID=UPI0014574CCF|nr:GNAT family N-acetyltransferase [Levilactobacillus tujiorum]NLR31345.1 GNAT family N-acetyltransferase [Levilactobacillus tujiorum]
MEIRKARPDDDFEAVAQLYLTVWRRAYRGLLPADFLAQLTPATWQPRRRWQQTWLAFDHGLLVGSCAAGPARQPQRAAMGEIYSIYVLPQKQQRGIGQQLMQAALTELATTYPQVYLEVLAANQAAQSFYRRLGFTQKGPVQLRTVPQGELALIEMSRGLP